MIPANLPGVASARLPVSYENARTALAECSRIDECKDWADRAAAIASYAKQANDETLHRYADRIKARAIRRCGELLKQIPPDKGGRPPAETQEGDLPSFTRTEAADAAGLSEHQRKTALRVASVPEADFERQVESDTPPTVTVLAEQGKQIQAMRGDASVAQFRAATKALATLREFSEFVRSVDAVDVANGVQPAEVASVRRQVSAIDAWLDRFVVSLKE